MNEQGMNEKLPDGFKMTELGPLPEEWEVVRLGDIVEFNLGRTPKRSDKSYWADGKYSWVSIADMNDFGYIYNTKEKVSQKAYEEVFKKRLVPKETLLMSFKLTIGRTSILKIDAFHNEAIISIYPNKNYALKYFLFYFLPTINFSNYYDNVVKGKTLNSAKIKKLLIPLPPLPEQKKIAAVLSSVQSAKEKTEAVIEATKALKKSMMKHLFTYGPVSPQEAENVPLKETEIGPVPEDWEVVRLGDVAKVKYGKANPKDTGNIPVVGSGGIYSSTADPIVDYPTIVVGRKGTAGKVWLFLEPCYPSDTTFYLEWEKDIEVSFLFNYMILNPLSGEYAKTTLPSLQKPDLENFLIPYPPLPIQQKIASILSAIDAKIEAEENKKKALEDLFKTLLHNLMTANIRVNQLEVTL